MSPSRSGVHKGRLRTGTSTRASGIAPELRIKIRQFSRVPSCDLVAEIVHEDTMATGKGLSILLREATLAQMEEAYYILQGPKAETIHRAYLARMEEEA